MSDFRLFLACSCSPNQGRPLVTFDPKAEAKLRMKIDLYVVPTVAILYLFCFIDVSGRASHQGVVGAPDFISEHSY